MIEWDKEGVLRFKPNRIVQDVYDHNYDLNTIEQRYRCGHYTFEEKYHFLMLIGYSIDGLCSQSWQDIHSPESEEE